MPCAAMRRQSAIEVSAAMFAPLSATVMMSPHAIDSPDAATNAAAAWRLYRYVGIPAVNVENIDQLAVERG